MKSLRLAFFLAFSLLLSKAVLAADVTVETSYALPDHGTLVMQVPSGWNHEVRKHPGDFPPTILLTGLEASPFVVMITPRWAEAGSAGDFGSPNSIHAIVESAAHSAEPQAEEDRLSIVTLGGGKGPGYYFNATDRAPKPGDFKYMTQGAVRVGELVCTFTILTNDEKSTVQTKTLNMLSGAVQRPDK